ncbi:MAG: glycosyltransferase [Alphaproteobacteria bacterium]|nr:glycosyltransferase [Alphaproteobacteria bacterium]
MEQPESSAAGEASAPPLLSMIWYGRGNADHARAALQALQTQAVQSCELVVVDCGSSDDTVETFREAAKKDARIVLSSRWSTPAGDALLRALRLCRGEWIGVLPTNGVLKPRALELAAEWSARNPTVGAVCTPGFLVDAHGGNSDRIDIVTLILSTARPHLPAAIIRRQALVLSGLEREDWLLDALALDISYRLAADHGLAFASDVIAEPAKLDDNHGLPFDVMASIGDHLALADRAFSRDGFFGTDHASLRLECQANQLAILRTRLEAAGRHDLVFHVMRRAEQVLADFDALLKVDHRALRSLQRLLAIRSKDLGLLDGSLQKLLRHTWEMRHTSEMQDRLPIHIGYTTWNMPLLGPWMKRKATYQTLPEPSYHPLSPGRDALFADLYVMFGQRYEARGQVDLAVEMWNHAQPADNIDIDIMACQAMLKSPAASDAALAERQRRWVAHHLGERPWIALPRNKSGKIRVGYHCAFMSGDTMRYMMGNVIAAHDRTDFEVYGYAPLPIPGDIERGFDAWRLTPPPTKGLAPPKSYTDDEFMRLVRSDRIDVFVELTGFSPGNRFGAMSLRCAPVQVSFLNHTGTSQVPNVDYVLSDEICIATGSEAEKHYSEKIYRIPGCFFCFDYTIRDDSPPIAPPPFVRNGFVTFGCFGSGSKIGTALIEQWARILRHVPGSVLRIQNPQLSGSGERRYMAERFRQFGVAADRLTLEGGVDRPTLLRAYASIDISLDTWPYSGGNTIAESLWHGVPVVTYRGDRFSSAYGASLVTAGGCSDLVAHSFEQYVRIASDLASDGDRLKRLRRLLRQRSVDCGLGDSWSFSRKLERSYRDMLDRLDGERGTGDRAADGRKHVS